MFYSDCTIQIKTSNGTNILFFDDQDAYTFRIIIFDRINLVEITHDFFLFPYVLAWCKSSHDYTMGTSHYKNVSTKLVNK